MSEEIKENEKQKEIKAIFEEYFSQDIEIGNIKMSKIKAFMVLLEDIAMNSKNEALRMRAIELTFKSLGLYDNKTNIDIDKDNNINIKVEYK